MLKQAPVPAHPVLIRTGKFALAFLAAVLAAVFCALMALRFWVWPSLPQQQASLAAALAPELQKHGLTLRMGTVTADWPSWVTPRLKVEAIEIFKSSGERVLAVKELEATLGWKSLAMVWRWQPIFHEIRFLDPFVFVERESQGVLRVAGFEVRPSDAQDPAAINWLLRQGRLRADGGEMIWFDRVRAKSARLQSITLALNNLGFAHSWALKATPPPTLGDPFVVQGDFSHGFFKSPADFLSWGGEAFIQFDRVNFSELLGFIHLPKAVPLQMTSGSGAVRAWLKLNKSQLDDLTLDVNVSNVSLAWGRTKRPMSMQELSGRIQAQIGDARNKVALKNIKLKSTQLAETVEISDAQLVIEQPPGSDKLSGQISAASIDLNAGMWLMDHLPLAADLKKQITQLAPRGRLSGLSLSWREASEELSALSLETSFSDLALAAGAKRPGFSGLSGKIKASESGGEIALDSKKAVLTFPGIFREPALSFDSLSAQASFSGKNLLARSAETGSTNAQEISVQVKKLNIENADLKADANGSYRWLGKGPGRAEFTSRIARVKPERIARYTPLEVDADTREWLRIALLPGKPYSGTVELAGDLNDFPFRTTGSGKFLVRAKAEDANLRPAPGWPVMSDIDADVEFDRHQFRLVAKNAKLSDLIASEIKASIEDMEAKTVILKVDGGLTGDLSRLIDAVNRSPLRQSMGGVTSSAVGRGSANLALSMALDLTNTDRSKVNGTLSLSKASLRLMPAMPEASNVNAEIGFDEDGIKTMKAQGQMAGGPVNAAATRVARTTAISVDGQVSGSGLEAWIESALGYSARNSLTGSSRYTAQIELLPGETRARIQSGLTGIASDLPALFRKSSSEDWGLRVEMIQSQAKEATAKSAVRPSTQRWVVSSNQQRFNARINVGSGKTRETIIDLDSPTVAGQLSWQPARDSGRDSARDSSRRAASATRSTIPILRARLTKLHLEPSKSSESGQAPQPTDAAAQEWPTVDAVVEDFRVGERQWGRLEVQASPVAATRSWEILKFSVANPDAVLTGQGQWAMMGAARGPKRSRTSLNIELQMKNGGGLLARSGYPNLVRATPGKIEGALNWPGSPIQFSGAALSGNLSFNLEQGQFLKSEPGIARLVGVLNLQSLPRRIKLDFRDVFSEGFTYERIRGDLQFNNGQASTQNFRIIGIQASVILEGTADLKDEKQDLRVLVLPEVNAGLASLGYAALVNPAVGLGAFIAQYILRNPVRELLSYEYKVTGSWTEPVVEQVKREVKTDSPDIKAPAK